jgi:hypothetical protein
MIRNGPPQNPLQPIASVVGVLTVLAGLFLILSVLVRQQAWGNGPVCTSVPANGIPLRISGLSVGGMVRGSEVTIGNVVLCANHPNVRLRLVGLMASWSSVLLWLGFLFQLRRLLKIASQEDALYSPGTASRLRVLGWFLAAGALVVGLIETAANMTIFLSQVHYPGLTWFEPDKLHLPVVALLVGLSLITVARVMRVGVTMREELNDIV